MYNRVWRVPAQHGSGWCTLLLMHYMCIYTCLSIVKSISPFLENSNQSDFKSFHRKDQFRQRANLVAWYNSHCNDNGNGGCNGGVDGGGVTFSLDTMMLSTIGGIDQSITLLPLSNSGVKLASDSVMASNAPV